MNRQMEPLAEVFIEMIDPVIIARIGDCNKIIPPDNLEVKYHQGMPFLTLRDIAEQITKIYGKTIIIDVWIELALNGYIYRYVGPDGEWKKHGHTKGYA
ncbi:hypothetical protein MOD24_17065 [Bacillus haynesii]|uniref:hypothetical protein n=1 Tax=Bacillus haynesii TaxID=1925021 RepID=UPI00227F1853|nr:hypothetical protein [Bacillus haynesii]MCY8577557.1 hypothetical protein [Bacillus haynesii]MEC1657096.1 hypothetical protein [Bacillus haynesii]